MALKCAVGEPVPKFGSQKSLPSRTGGFGRSVVSLVRANAVYNVDGAWEVSAKFPNCTLPRAGAREIAQQRLCLDSLNDLERTFDYAGEVQSDMHSVLARNHVPRASLTDAERKAPTPGHGPRAPPVDMDRDYDPSPPLPPRAVQSTMHQQHASVRDGLAAPALLLPASETVSRASRGHAAKLRLNAKAERAKHKASNGGAPGASFGSGPLPRDELAEAASMLQTDEQLGEHLLKQNNQQNKRGSLRRISSAPSAGPVGACARLLSAVTTDAAATPRQPMVYNVLTHRLQPAAKPACLSLESSCFSTAAKLAGAGGENQAPKATVEIDEIIGGSQCCGDGQLGVPDRTDDFRRRASVPRATSKSDLGTTCIPATDASSLLPDQSKPLVWARPATATSVQVQASDALEGLVVSRSSRVQTQRAQAPSAWQNSLRSGASSQLSRILLVRGPRACLLYTSPSPRDS